MVKILTKENEIFKFKVMFIFKIKIENIKNEKPRSQ